MTRHTDECCSDSNFMTLLMDPSPEGQERLVEWLRATYFRTNHPTGKGTTGHRSASDFLHDVQCKLLNAEIPADKLASPSYIRKLIDNQFVDYMRNAGVVERGRTLKSGETVYNQVKQQNVESVVWGNDGGGFHTLLDHRSDEPDAPILLAELTSKIHSAIAGLEDEDRGIATMFYIVNFTQAQIAIAYNTTEQAICARLARIRAKLKLTDELKKYADI